MGLTIKGSFKGSPEYSAGYTAFYDLRCRIAKAIMKDGYQIFEAWTKTTHKDSLDYVKMLNEAIYSYGEAFYEFTTSSDCEGSISYKQCKELYEQLKDKDVDLSFCYYGFKTDESKNDIKNLLKDCYSHRARLIWF